MTDRLDDAIDHAVREMLDVEPRADLRERVVAQLAASGSQLPASGWMTVASAFRRNLVVSAAAAALILLAVFVAHRSEPLPEPPVVARGADVHLAPNVRAYDTQPGAPPVSLRSVSARAEPHRETDVTAVARTDIAPLTGIAPIAVTPIESERIAPADIAVRQLNTINEIQIAPLAPPDRR